MRELKAIQTGIANRNGHSVTRNTVRAATGSPQRINANIKVIRSLVKSNGKQRRVLERLKLTKPGGGVLPTRARFWKALVVALVTTRQKSTEGSNVSRFVKIAPFPLSLSNYIGLTNRQVVAVLRKHRIGFQKGITKSLRDNYRVLFLEENYWLEIRPLLIQLLQQRNCKPSVKQKDLERSVARALHKTFRGIGPKQSRNVLQILGLVRYETPLDSRVTGWIKKNLGWRIKKGALDRYTSYEKLLDRVQKVCKDAGVLPTVFDGAAFEIGKGKSSPNKCPKYSECQYIRVGASRKKK